MGADEAANAVAAGEMTVAEALEATAHVSMLDLLEEAESAEAAEDV